VGDLAQQRSAVDAQVLGTGGRQSHKRAASGAAPTRDEAPVVRVLPHGQARTRRLPYVEHLGVRLGVTPKPLEEIEDQVVDRTGRSDRVGGRWLTRARWRRLA